MLLENRRLALIEDDPIMGGSLVQRLELEGAQVSWWRSANEALLLLEAVRVHCLGRMTLTVTI